MPDAWATRGSEFRAWSSSVWSWGSDDLTGGLAINYCICIAWTHHHQQRANTQTHIYSWAVLYIHAYMYRWVGTSSYMLWSLGWSSAHEYDRRVAAALVYEAAAAQGSKAGCRPCPRYKREHVISTKTQGSPFPPFCFFVSDGLREPDRWSCERYYIIFFKKNFKKFLLSIRLSSVLQFQ